MVQLFDIIKVIERIKIHQGQKVIKIIIDD